LLSAGVLTGLCLMMGTINQEFNKLLGNNDELYIFISGIAVIATSISEIRKSILPKSFSLTSNYLLFTITIIAFFVAMIIYLE
jgi:hypothetical protein